MSNCLMLVLIDSNLLCPHTSPRQTMPSPHMSLHMNLLPLIIVCATGSFVNTGVAVQLSAGISVRQNCPPLYSILAGFKSP
jgi:hypothetical protein